MNNIIDSAITKECLNTLLSNHSVEREAFDVAQVLVKLEKLLPKEIYRTLGANKMVIFVNYNIVPDLTMVDLKGVTISYVQGNGIVHEELTTGDIVYALERLEIYSLEYIPIMNALNIKTVPYIKQIAEKYPKQLSSAIDEYLTLEEEFFPNNKSDLMKEKLSTNITTNVCWDYLQQFNRWWSVLREENYALIGKGQIKKLVNHLIPIAIFTDQDSTALGKVIQECVKKTVLQEHFYMEMFERSSKKTGITNMITIYWVSFKNAMEFLDTDNYRALSPVTILETLLANFGYVESNLCGLNQKQYSRQVDQYGIERYTRLNPVAINNNQELLPLNDIDLDLDYLLGEYSDINDVMNSNGDFTFKDATKDSGLLEDII